MVYPAFEVPARTYQTLEILIQNPEIKSITLMVTDNAFGA
jgi:hypothetical protein